MIGIVLLVFVVTVFAVAPNQPELNSPANNTVVYNNHPTLNITVTDDDSDYLNVSFYGSGGNTNNLCYQETATESTTCGGLDTGNYTLSGNWDYGPGVNIYDGNWSTYGETGNNAAYIGYVYITYQKPTNVLKDSDLKNSLWYVKSGRVNGNLTINDSCWQQDELSLLLTSHWISPNECVTAYCNNGSDWIIVERGCAGGADSNKIYEEAMWWNIPLIDNTTNTANNSYVTYNWTSLANGEYEWFTTITAGTDTTTSPVYAFSIYDYNYTVNHTTPVLETSSQTFTLNITRNSTYVEDGNATLHWNGTAYPVDAVVYDTYLWFSKTLTIPSVSANTNVTLNWTYEFWNPSNNSRENNRTEDFTQLIYNIDMDDCSTYSIVALNFSLIEESNNASIAGDMDFTFSLVQEGITINYSKSVTGVNSTAFCIPTNEVSFTAQLQSEYSATDYDAHTYFAYNLAITNATQYIYYYLTNGTSIVEFTVLDQNGDEVENAYIKVKKYDIGTGTYKTIETLKTDQQGKALGNIILDTTWYEFVVEYGGTVYLTDGPTKITTTSRTFRINLLTDFFAQYTDVIYGIISSLNYTDATGNFRFTWSDPDGNYHWGCLKVTKESLAGNTLINETCVQSTAGTILINVNDSGSVNGTYVAVGYIKFDEPYVLQILRKTWGSLSETFGNEGLFYGFLIILTVAMVGIFAPKVAIILAVIGLVFSSILGFFNMNPSWIIALVIAAGLTIYRMRDN